MACKLANSYSIAMEVSTINGYIEQWWVKGVSLVKETHTNTDDGSELVFREVSSVTGLTPE